MKKIYDFHRENWDFMDKVEIFMQKIIHKLPKLLPASFSVQETGQNSVQSVDFHFFGQFWVQPRRREEGGRGGRREEECFWEYWGNSVRTLAYCEWNEEADKAPSACCAPKYSARNRPNSRLWFLICQFLRPGTVTLLYQTHMLWHLQTPNFSQKYRCNPTHVYIETYMNVYVLYMYTKNVDLGWGQRRRTSRIWCLFNESKTRKQFCAGLSLFKETGAEKNRWNLKKRSLNHVRKCDNGGLKVFKLEKNFGGPNS